MQMIDIQSLTPEKLKNDAAYRRAACMAADGPTFGQMEVAFGAQRASRWLASHFINFGQMVGIQFDKLPDPATTAAICSSLISRLPRMRVQWLWVFFLDELAGRWGKKTYSRMDIADIGADMAQFLAAEAPVSHGQTASQKPQKDDGGDVVVDVEEWAKNIVDNGGYDSRGRKVTDECLAECRRMLHYFRTPKKQRKWLK